MDNNTFWLYFLGVIVFAIVMIVFIANSEDIIKSFKHLGSNTLEIERERTKQLEIERDILNKENQEV